MHNDAITPVVASVLLLILVAGCCTVIGLLVMQQMNAQGASDVPDVRIQASAREKMYYLYHAGGDPLPRSSLKLYDATNTDILYKTSINGNGNWISWNSGEYLYSSRQLPDILLVWMDSSGKETILFRNGKTGLSMITDTVPD